MHTHARVHVTFRAGDGSEPYPFGPLYYMQAVYSLLHDLHVYSYADLQYILALVI